MRFARVAVTAVFALGVGVTDVADAAPTCKAIRFARGATSAKVTGFAPAEGSVCYAVQTNAGQHASIAVESKNTGFYILDVTDLVDAVQFTTEKKTYEIHVAQLLRSLTHDPFELRVSITGRPTGRPPPSPSAR